MSYVMQQNHRQGNRRSNVLTSLVSLFFRTPGTLKMSKYHMERKKTIKMSVNIPVYNSFGRLWQCLGASGDLWTTCNLTVDNG